MKVVEDMEEDILSLFFSTEELYVVNNQHVYHLIEVAEVVHCVVSDRVNKLMSESFRGNIQDCFVWSLIFNLNSYSVS